MGGWGGGVSLHLYVQNSMEQEAFVEVLKRVDQYFFGWCG